MMLSATDPSKRWTSWVTTPMPRRRAAGSMSIGCGTGCICCSIASERPGVHVTTTDVSQLAVSLAMRNRDALGLARAIDVVECDLASGVDEGLMGTFDLLVSNPPYIVWLPM